MLATLVARASKGASRCSPVVVVKAPEHRSRDDRAGRLRQARHRLFMTERLMRTCLVVELEVLAKEPCEVLVAEDEHVVEELAAQSADEALGERVHVGRANRSAHDAHADRFEHPREFPSELGVAIDDQHLGCSVHRDVARLLCAPVVGRLVGDGGVENPTALQIHKNRMKIGRNSASKV